MAEDVKRGRPRTTVSKLPEDWKAVLIACGEDGGSAVEMRRLLGIAQTAWETLLADSEDFRVTVKDAQDACNVWWERLGRKLSADGGGNAAIWIFNMKNRFGWRDRADDAGDDAVTPTPLKVEVTVVDGSANTD